MAVVSGSGSDYVRRLSSTMADCSTYVQLLPECRTSILRCPQYVVLLKARGGSRKDDGR